MLKNLSNPFTLNLRSLAAMRVAVAICVLIDLAIRSTDLVAHYTDQGILPLELLFRYGWLPEYFSFYQLGNSPMWTIIVFAIHGLVGLLLLVGVRTRLVTFLCWLLMVSLHNRNHLILQGGDDLLRLLLFWGMFLPWGNYFSVDKLRGRIIAKPLSYRSVAGIGYVLLVFSMYFFSAILKNGSDWNVDFTALYYAYQLDMIVWPLGKWLLPYYDLLQVFTALAYYLELLLPLVLLIPWGVKWWRIVFLVLICGFHVCIGSTLFVGLFPLTSAAAIIGLLPSSFWKQMWKWQLIRKVYLSSTIFLKSLIAKYFNINNEEIKPIYKNQLLDIGGQYLVGFLVALSLYLNYFQVGSYQIDVLEKTRPLVQLLRIDQHWGMFAPIVFRDDGWFVLEGTAIKSNSKIDIYNEGKKIDYTKPENLVTKVKNDRWRKYQENILFVNNNGYRPYYCSWLLKEWNKTAPLHKQILKLQIVYIKEVSKPNYTTGATTREMLCECSF